MNRNTPPPAWFLRVVGIFVKGAFILTIVIAAVVLPWLLWMAWTRNRSGLEAFFVTALCGSFVWFSVSTWQWSRSFRKLIGASSTRLLLGPRPEDPSEVSAWWWGRHCRYSFLAMALSILAIGLTLWRRGE